MKPGPVFVTVALVALVAVAGIFFFSAWLQCVGGSCIGGGGPNPITHSQSVYFDISTSSGWTAGISGQVLPSAGTTGEVVKSCQWITCAVTGREVPDTISVSGPNGQAFAQTWHFRLGIGADKEEYVWLAPSLPAGTYTVTVTAQEAGAGTSTAGATFTVPLAGSVGISGS